MVSLQFETDMLPAKWEALRRGIEFWVQVMRMNDDRLVKVVMLEALEIGSKVKWASVHFPLNQAALHIPMPLPHIITPTLLASPKVSQILLLSSGPTPSELIT